MVITSHGNPLLQPSEKGAEVETVTKNLSVPDLVEYHGEAYYLYLIAGLGIVLNLVVIVRIIWMQRLRKMTSSFLIHGCLLNAIKSAFCIPFGNSLLTQIDPEPRVCGAIGSAFIVFVTTSTFNMIAAVCSEAYTFGEANIGGDSRGTFCCVLFGFILVYTASLILHLGPTVIGGQFKFHKKIGICTFELGKTTSYIAYIIWIFITTLSLLAVGHYLRKLHKEIQINKPNRVSMLVRSSICISNQARSSESSVRLMIQDSSHRAKLLLMSTVSYIACWYPLFILILIDFGYHAPPKLYQTFSFIAWTHGTLEAILYIMFDRHLRLFSQIIYCDHRRQQVLDNIAFLMSGQGRTNQEAEGANMIACRLGQEDKLPTPPVAEPNVDDVELDEFSASL